VVVGQIEVCNTVRFQENQIFGFGTEDKSLVDRRLDFGSWAFEIGTNEFTGTKNGVDFGTPKGVDP
jgi:hypothetical protein